MLSVRVVRRSRPYGSSGAIVRVRRARRVRDGGRLATPPFIIETRTVVPGRENDPLLTAWFQHGKGPAFEFATREAAEAHAQSLEDGAVWVDGEDLSGKGVLETRIVDLTDIPDFPPES